MFRVFMCLHFGHHFVSMSGDYGDRDISPELQLYDGFIKIRWLWDQFDFGQLRQWPHGRYPAGYAALRATKISGKEVSIGYPLTRVM